MSTRGDQRAMWARRVQSATPHSGGGATAARTRNAWLASALWALCGAAAAADDSERREAPKPCATRLSAEQSAKFRLSAQQVCLPVVEAPERAALESVHLRLFDAQGTVSVRGDATPARPAAALPRSAEPAPAPMNLPKAGLAEPRALRLAPEVDAVARRHDIDPLLLHAIAWVESRHQVDAVSRAGAQGLMQVMPATARRFGVDSNAALRQPGINLDVSASYLKTLQGRFGTDLPLVLAAYNAGEGAVERHGRRIPPYPETRGYVQQVLARYEWLSSAARAARKARVVS